MHPARRERRGGVHERRVTIVGCARDEVRLSSSSTATTAAAARTASTPSVSNSVGAELAHVVDDRASAATSSSPAGPRTRRPLEHPVGTPDVVLVGEGDQVAGCRAQRLLEIRRHAQRDGFRSTSSSGVAASARMLLDHALARARPCRPRRVVAEHDLVDRAGLRRMLSSCSPRNRAPLWVPSATETRGAAVARHQRSRLRPTLSTPRNMPAMIVWAPSIMRSAASTAVRTVSVVERAEARRRPRGELPDRDREADEEEGEAHQGAALQADPSLEAVEVPRSRDAEPLVLRVDLREDREQDGLVADHGQRGQVDLARDVEADVAEDDRAEAMNSVPMSPRKNATAPGSGTASAD